MRKALAIVLIFCVFSFSGCERQVPSATETVYAMDTVMTLTAYGAEAKQAIARGKAEILAMDDLLDRHDNSSAVAVLNRTGRTEEKTLCRLLETAQSMGALSQGAFDPTVAGLLDLWGFGQEQQRLPSSQEIAQALATVGNDRYVVDPGVCLLEDGCQVDLGGIAKGYVAGLVGEIYRQLGCTGTIDLGGDVSLVGKKQDGSDWRVAIKDPANPSEFLGILTCSDTFVVTSGVYERCFEQDGKRYHHLLDPATGYPAESGLLSVTVICPVGEMADALSTAAFVLGSEKALAMKERSEIPFELVMVTEEGNVLYTEGLQDQFHPETKGRYHYEILR